MEKFECCICGKECEGFGNDPWPVVSDDDARCCDTCNSESVIPARIMRMIAAKMAKDSEPLYSKQEILDVGNMLMNVYGGFVNSAQDAEERGRRDSIVYPMVFGTNLLGNVLMYGISEELAYDAVRRFYDGEEFYDKNDGTPMRKKVRDGEDSEE